MRQKNMKKYEYHGVMITTKEDIFESLNEHCSGDMDEQAGIAVFDDMVPAFIGFTNNNRDVYDYRKMVRYHMEVNGMTEEDAAEYIKFNVLQSLPYMEKPPVILYPVNKAEGE